jgi:hypothetical protein
MSYPARALMAGLACFVVWTMVRAWRSGTIFSQGSAYSADEQPAVYALGLAAHGFGAVFLLWLAAGNDQRSFFGLFGLDFDRFLDRFVGWCFG